MDQKIKHVLSQIAQYRFVKEALQTVVFNKLLFDGYVCCTNGLYPSNKQSLKKALKQSPYYPIIEKNSSNYTELLFKLKKLIINENTSPSFEESQSIVYAILETDKITNNSDIIFLLLCDILGKTRFYQNGDFIVENNTELINIETLDSFIAKLETIPEKTNVLFRGHPNINYGIQPSLFRTQKYYKNEYMMYQELVIRCPEYFSSCHSHLDFLVKMQHYGLPTRLLDFTFNPLIALYFACENQSDTGEIIIYTVSNRELFYEKDEKAVILSCLPMLSYKKQKQLFYSLLDKKISTNAQKELIDEIRIERPSFSRRLLISDIRMPIFVKPSRNNIRIAHQEGAFLLWGLDTVHYDNTVDTEYVGDQEKYRLRNNGKKVIFYIQQKNKEKIKKTLNRIGINKAFVYPEIDDVADYLKNTVE